jgi:polyisoprenoid-binding protein YceI
VAIPSGRYALGPDDGTLSVRTQRTGAAAMAGHNLLFHVTSWEAVLVVGDDPSDAVIEVSADGGSLRVQEGTGGVQSLSDDQKAEIEQTVDNEVLKGEQISFESKSVRADGDGLRVEGDLTLHGTTRPLGFDVAMTGDGMLGATAVIKQTDWGMKPYSTLFGALKVVDEVEVSIDARLGA